jgi:hypothetical protein
MSVQVASHRIRLQVDATKKGAVVDQITGSDPWSWRGVFVQVEIGIFQAGVFADSISNIDKIYLLAALNTKRSTVRYWQKEIDSAEMNATLTASEWATKDSDKAHATFDLSAADTNFDFTYATDNVLGIWLVTHIKLKTTARPITLGGASWSVQEDSVDDSIPVTGMTPQGIVVTSDFRCLVRNRTSGKYHEMELDGPADNPSPIFGPEETVS